MVGMIVVLVMILLNAVFAAYEIALASVSLGRLQLLREQGRPGSAASVRMKERVEASLAVVQVGITLVGAIAAATGGSEAGESLTPWIQRTAGLSRPIATLVALACIVAPLTAVTILFGELVPKVFALRNREWVCLALSPVMLGLANAVWPVVRGFEWSIERVMNGMDSVGAKPSAGQSGDGHQVQEIRASAAVARASRHIGAREERIILGAADLRTLPVEEAMLPAARMRSLALDLSLHEALIQAHLDMHTRFPVATKRDDPQSIIGYVNFKDIVGALHISKGSPSLAGIMRPLESFPASMPLSDCLEKMIHTRIHIALVRSADGTIVGLLTLEDVLEQIVGEIEDEHDKLPSHVRETPYGWILGGGLSLRDASAVFGCQIEGRLDEQSQAGTLNDLITARLGREPQGGDSIEASGLRFNVRKSRRGRAMEIQVIRPAALPRPLAAD